MNFVLLTVLVFLAVMLLKLNIRVVSNFIKVFLKMST